MAKAHRYIAIGVIVLIPVQVFLAGLNVMGGEDIEPHKGLGHLFELLGLILVILAAVRRRESLQASIAFLVLVVLQNPLANIDSAAVTALHPVNALFILGTAVLAATGRPLFGSHGGGRAETV